MKRKLFYCLLCLFFLVGCNHNKEQSTTTNTPNSKTNSKLQVTAQEIVDEMKVGWNLGNALDCCDYKKYSEETASQKQYDYQLLATYTTATWSGWDQSDIPYFDGQGNVQLEWNIKELTQDVTMESGSLSFQIVNHGLKCDKGSLLGINVSKACFIKADGSQIVLEDMLGNHYISFADGVTVFVEQKLNGIEGLLTTQDILNGTLQLEVSIIQYLEAQDQGIGVSPEEYYETLWGNPVTSKAMIDQIAAAGFGAIRIPVTYCDHMNNQYIIEKDWLARVKEVVDYCLENDLYCIINLHHDGAWLKADYATIESQKKNLKKVWQQIAAYFKDYNEQLLFEGFNEVLNKEDQWSEVGKEPCLAINELNQTFVDTIREGGGKNKERFLIVNTYAASGREEFAKYFIIPKDSIDQHIIAEIHYYGTLDKMKAIFASVEQYIVSQGVPVIIGEFAPNSDIEETTHKEYVNTFTSTAKEKGFTVFWWDEGISFQSGKSKTKALFNRSNLEWYDKALMETFVQCSETIK